MADNVPYTQLPSAEEVNESPKPETNEPPTIHRQPLAGAPGVVVAKGIPTVQETFHPSTMLAWDRLENMMKLWLALSVADMIMGLSLRYLFYSGILGVVGSSIYLFSCCQGEVPGITRSRMNNLTMLSMVDAIVSTMIGVLFLIYTMIGIYYGLQSSVAFWFVAFSLFQLGHAAASLTVFRRLRTLNNILRAEADQVEMA